MYVWRINFKNQRLNSLVQQSKYYSRFNCHDYSGAQRLIPSALRSCCLIGKYLSKSSFSLAQDSERHSTRLKCHSHISWRNCLLRYYSSEGDGRNANEDKCVTSQDVDNCHKENNHKANTTESSRNCDAHAQLGEQDQMDWLKNKKLAIENKRKESPFLTRHERFKIEFLRRIIPWEKITLSWDTFPYYLDEHTKKLLVECVASHVKHKKFTSDYGSRLLSSSAKILLQSIPGTELYRERLVRALARDLQVPLMVLDGSIVAPYDLSEDESESDDENSESTSDSDVEDENDTSNEEDYTSSSETKTEGSDDEVVDNASAEALKKLIPGSIEEFEKSVSGESESSSTSSQSENVESSDKANQPVKKGDRVRYTGASIRIEANNSVSSNEKKEDSKNSNDHEGDRSWINVYLPEKIQAYARLARLDKPIGTWLLAWPCMWSITMAATPGSIPNIKMMLLFGTGALLLRGAGCTVNDLLDRDIDTRVERTMRRPIASGVITPFQGTYFLGFQLLLGLGILLQLNNFSRVLGASSLLLVFSYPLMKRLTFWPQAYLGLTFNWGALLGWAAVKGNLDPAVVFPLYASGVFWTLVYDTIYAHQDKEDDQKVGVKSTALRFGDSTKQWISGFGLACIASLTLSGYNANIGYPYYMFITAASAQLGWQIMTVDLSSRADCNRKFVSNKWFGSLVFCGILLGRLSS